MRYIRSLATGVMLGSMGAVVASFGGCSSQEQKQEAQNKFLVIEQLSNGKYVVVEEIPTQGPNRAIIRERQPDGTVKERLMSEDELRKLAQQEYERVKNGTSETLQEGGGEGMGLAGTILAVAAGSLLGNMIANSLFSNPNFRHKAQSVNRSAYARSKTGSLSKKSTSTKKSFFGGSSKSSSYGKTSFFGG